MKYWSVLVIDEERYLMHLTFMVENNLVDRQLVNTVKHISKQMPLALSMSVLIVDDDESLVFFMCSPSFGLKAFV